MTNRAVQKLYWGSWSIVAYTIVIILWGAWVRLSGSGDGCGDHWPLCNGEVIPVASPLKTWIEFSHRISTAAYGALVVLQIILVHKLFSRRHPARFWAWMTLLFTITEALIGRQLVTLGLVNQSTDLWRLIVMPVHLINTSMLLFSGVMTAESVRWGTIERRRLTTEQKRRGGLYLTGFGIVLLTGAIAALGSHLAPSESLLSGLAHDLSDDSHLAVKLRIFHPILALLIPIGLFLLAQTTGKTAHPSSAALWYWRFIISLGLALIIGMATLTLLAPVWLKISHLLATNVLVVIFSLCIFHTLRPVSR